MIAENDDSGNSFNSELVEQLDAGTYFVTVGAYADAGTGTYQLDLQHEPDSSSSGYYSFTNSQVREIDDFAPNRVWTDIDVSGISGQITDVNVQVDIEHTWVGDLRLVLISPDGTRIQLSNRYGGDGDDYAGTIFDQQADVPISQGEAPFEGSYKSKKNLNLLNGEDPNGRWRLLVIDFEYFDGGALNGWTLDFTTDAARKKTVVSPSAVATTPIRVSAADVSESARDLWLQQMDQFQEQQGLSGCHEIGSESDNSLVDRSSIEDDCNDLVLSHGLMDEYFAYAGRNW